MGRSTRTGKRQTRPSTATKSPLCRIDIGGEQVRLLGWRGFAEDRWRDSASHPRAPTSSSTKSHTGRVVPSGRCSVEGGGGALRAAGRLLLAPTALPNERA